MIFDNELRILRQESGSFNHRFQIGPASWPHFDLLWIHEGRVSLTFGDDTEPVVLTAPDGVLIFPDVPFRGKSISGQASASICHFQGNPKDGAGAPNFLRPKSGIVLHTQNLIRLSLSYARRDAEMMIRTRLLTAILDCFGQEKHDEDRVTAAWRKAEARLSGIRGLSDVAALAGLSESAFRALHRAAKSESAGAHLRKLRLNEAEKLLATTGDTVAEVAHKVGYAHPESFSVAFKSARGQSPAAFRRWSRRFA